MNGIKIGRILAAAAVVVALPRHLIAQLHAAGFAAPSSEAWIVLVVGSAMAWAILEAVTMFAVLSAYQQSRQRRLLWLAGAILGSIAITNAPSLVADSAGIGLVALLGVASIGHWVWSVSSIAATLLVVVAAAAADAAIEEKRVSDRIDELDRQNAIAQAARNAPETASQRPATLPQLPPGRIDGPQIVALLAANPTMTNADIARRIGVTRQAVSAWRKRNG